MVHLVGADAVDEIDQPAAGREVAIMQEHADVRKVRVYINMIDTTGIECAGATNDAVHFITLRQKQLGKIRAVLPGDSRDQSTLQRAPHLPEGLEHLKKQHRSRVSFDGGRVAHEQSSIEDDSSGVVLEGLPAAKLLADLCGDAYWSIARNGLMKIG